MCVLEVHIYSPVYVCGGWVWGVDLDVNTTYVFVTQLVNLFHYLCFLFPAGGMYLWRWIEEAATGVEMKRLCVALIQMKLDDSEGFGFELEGGFC